MLCRVFSEVARPTSSEGGPWWTEVVCGLEGVRKIPIWKWPMAITGSHFCSCAKGLCACDDISWAFWIHPSFLPVAPRPVCSCTLVNGYIDTNRRGEQWVNHYLAHMLSRTVRIWLYQLPVSPTLSIPPPAQTLITLETASYISRNLLFLLA